MPPFVSLKHVSATVRELSPSLITGDAHLFHFYLRASRQKEEEGEGVGGRVKEEEFTLAFIICFPAAQREWQSTRDRRALTDSFLLLWPGGASSVYPFSSLARTDRLNPGMFSGSGDGSWENLTSAVPLWPPAENCVT